MPKQYICELCHKEFNQKNDFIRHINKKTPCVNLMTIEQTNKIRQNCQKKLLTLFKYCLNYLRDNEHLTGDKALRTLSHLLTLRLIINKIDFDNYDYDMAEYAENERENSKKILLDAIKCDNLTKIKEDNLPNIMNSLWIDILSKHPETKHIFSEEEDKGFNIKHAFVYKELINQLFAFHFESIDVDILGEIYEEIMKDGLVGKAFGQFFTSSPIKDLAVKLINPQLHADGTMETIFDPAMGTGGFLTSSLKHILKQSKEKNIDLNWDFITNHGLRGREVELGTFQLAESNMLISSGHIFNGLEYGDSIKQLISNEVDIVIANPPFGIKTLKYEKIDSHLKREYVPIETSNAVSLFLQIIIYILKINGRCAIVIPKGKDLFGETNDLIAIRKYLMKTCDLKEIIYLPSGLFINTDIETCIFYFVKKIKGSDVLTVKENRKNEKTYEFTDDYQTDKVIFYNYNIDTEEKEFLVEAPIEKIIQKNYSLNYINYLAEINNNNDDNVIIKTLGEISNIISGKRIEDKLEPGHYPIYGGGGLTLHYTNQFNREGKTCKISRDGISLHNCVMILNEKYYLSNHGSTISSKSDLLLNEYLWYYLLLHKEMVYECSQGMAQRGISIDRLNKLKIPIISIDKQKDIIKYLNFIYETCIKSSLSKIEELKQENQYYIKNQQNYGKNKINPLGEICEFLPKSQKPASYGKDSGLYPFYTSSQNCSKFCDEADYHEDALIIGTGGNPNIKFSNQFSCSTDNFIITINENIDIKFVYYYLLNNIQLLEKGFIGVTIKHLSKEFLCNIKICIPPIGRQKEIVEYCYFNDTLIKGLNKEIKKNKKASEQYMDDMLKGLIIKED